MLVMSLSRPRSWGGGGAGGDGRHRRRCVAHEAGHCDAARRAGHKASIDITAHLRGLTGSAGG